MVMIRPNQPRPDLAATVDSENSSHEDGPPPAIPLDDQAIVQGDVCPTPSEAPTLSVPGPQPAVPVMLLTGYLGAGKTTLVNYILTAKHGYRCAVLLNEIGDSADIERALVREPEGAEAAALADWVQLENGCICCSVKSDMVQALEALLLQRDRFDYVLIETTGLANPGPVAAALWTDPQLESGVCLDAVVTVVDAKNALRQLRERQAAAVNEAQQQIAYADVVLLNKVDLVDAAALAAVEAELRAINSEAVILRCERCEVDLGRVLHTGLYSAPAAAAATDTSGPEAPEPAAEAGSAGLEHTGEPVSAASLASEGVEGGEAPCQDGEVQLEAARHEHDDARCGAECGTTAHHHEDQSVQTVTVLLDRPLRLLHLRHWLDELLWEREGGPHREEVFRIKGLLRVEGSPSRWILQAVHDIYDVTEGAEWAARELEQEPRSKLVFIGRRLRRDVLVQELERCCAGLQV